MVKIFLDRQIFGIKLIYSALGKFYYWSYISTTILSTLIDFVGKLTLAYALSNIVATILSSSGNRTILYQSIIFYSITQLLSISIGYYNTYLSRIVRRNLRNSLSIMISDKLHTLDLSLLDDPKVNNSINYIKENSNVITELLPNQLKFLKSLITLVLLVLTISTYNFWFIIIILLTQLPNLFVDNKFLKRLIKFQLDNTEKSRQKDDILYSILLYFNSAFEIRNLNLVKYLKDQYFINFDFLSKFEDKLYAKWDSLNSLMSFVQVIASNILIVNVALSAIAKQITLDTFMIQFRMIPDLSSQINQFSFAITAILESQGRIDAFQEFFELKSSDSNEKIRIDKFDKIEFKNLNFIYPNSDKYILKDLNFTIKAGEKIAIVGENGAGKSTLIKLFVKNYNVTDGQILVNDTNINGISEESWLSQLSMMSQDYNFYACFNLEQNVKMGNLQIDSDEDFEKAITLSTLNQFRSTQLDKPDQILSSRYTGGKTVSSGNRQKITIAKFLYRKSPICIFDEPTSSIDAVSEEKIINNIFSELKDKTVIIISHKFSTVKKADKILVIANGTIAEMGSHEELMALNKIYATSFNLQAKAYD